MWSPFGMMATDDTLWSWPGRHREELHIADVGMKDKPIGSGTSDLTMHCSDALESLEIPQLDAHVGRT